MRFTILSLTLLGIVAADVSHLNNMYLPPLLGSLAEKQHTSYMQKTQEIPQASVLEVTDNSVTYENISAQEDPQRASGRLIAEHFKGFVDHIPNADIADQHIKNVADVADHQLQGYAQKSIVKTDKPVASVPQSHHSSQQQNAYAQEEAQRASGRLIVEPFKGFVQDHITNADVVDQHVKNVVNVADHQEQAYAHPAIVMDVETDKPVASVPQSHHSSQQQNAYYAPVSQQLQEAVPQQEPQQQYNVKQYVKPEQKYSDAHVEHHSDNAALGGQELAQQQQQPGYYSQQSTAVDSTASAGIETQYAANGGYVY